MPHSAHPASRPVQDLAYQAHEGLDPAGLPGRSGSLRLRGLRPVVRDSWQRSLRLATDPDRALARLVLAEDELDAFRRDHPLAAVMPVFSRLLVEPSHEAGMLVAVGDQHGRLLWVDGDTRLRERAEGMMFMPGTDWSEASVGTSAPGTALALGQGVQIAGAEHFSRAVHSWSCTAVPIHDPDSGAVLGVVDLTGGEEAAAPHTLSLVRAAVAAAEAELRIIRLQAAPSGRPRQQPAGLTITGRDHGLLELAGRRIELSQRHTEILTLMALHPAGLTAEQLADRLNPHARGATLRAEMVRLRKLLAGISPAAVPESRPYRLTQPLAVDAQRALQCLARGSYRQALELYQGQIIPGSEAPGIVDFRHYVSATLRESVLSSASPETVMRYLQLPEAKNDGDAWHAALRLLPPRSPRRAGVVARLEQLEAGDS
ncbi:GAF domain-containing protein [Arthrobacter sp. NPDC089319]|uniref:helix-turn-helix domain-containing protein n=1 Tax=Arthrobacter sp. NPDC089319 TaxID=3155915 RepID=UPI00344541E5